MQRRKRRIHGSGIQFATPWGRVASETVLEPGLQISRTANGGGGIIASQAFMRKEMTDEARLHSHVYSHYSCFSFLGDGSWAIVAFEVERLRSRLLWGHDLDVEPETYLLRLLSRDQPGYLEERGIEPNPEFFASGKRRAEAAAAVARKDRDTIVMVEREWRTGRPDVVQVTTADGNTWLVSRDSYDAQPPEHRVLSRCVSYIEPQGAMAPVRLAKDQRQQVLSVLSVLHRQGIRQYLTAPGRGCIDLLPEQAVDAAIDPERFLQTFPRLQEQPATDIYCTARTRTGAACRNLRRARRGTFRAGFDDRCELHAGKR